MIGRRKVFRYYASSCEVFPAISKKKLSERKSEKWGLLFERAFLSWSTYVSYLVYNFESLRTNVCMWSFAQCYVVSRG